MMMSKWGGGSSSTKTRPSHKHTHIQHTPCWTLRSLLFSCLSQVNRCFLWKLRVSPQSSWIIQTKVSDVCLCVHPLSSSPLQCSFLFTFTFTLLMKVSLSLCESFSRLIGFGSCVLFGWKNTKLFLYCYYFIVPVDSRSIIIICVYFYQCKTALFFISNLISLFQWIFCYCDPDSSDGCFALDSYLLLLIHLCFLF